MCLMCPIAMKSWPERPTGSWWIDCGWGRDGDRRGWGLRGCSPRPSDLLAEPEKVATGSSCPRTVLSRGLDLGGPWPGAPTQAPRSPQVLIPVFALGRAQELCILLETFW